MALRTQHLEALNTFLGALPSQTVTLRLRRFRRATLSSRAKEVGHDLFLSGEEGTTDLSPAGVRLEAIASAEAPLAVLELHPLPAIDDDEVLHHLVTTLKATPLTLETWTLTDRLERLGEPTAAPQSSEVTITTDAAGTHLVHDTIPSPPLWLRALVLTFTALLLLPLLLLLVVPSIRSFWTHLVLPMLWPRAQRWELHLTPTAVTWHWQPGWGSSVDGRVLRAELLAVSGCPDQWGPASAPLPRRLRLITTRGVVTVEAPTTTAATELALHHLLRHTDAP